MNDFTLTVLGANGYLGAEISRLGVALGAIIQGVARRGKAQWDEPWTHGVQWAQQSVHHAAPLDPLMQRSDAVVFAITRDDAHLDALDAALRAARHQGVEKFVYLSHDPADPWPASTQAITREAEARVTAHSMPWVILRAGLAWDDTQRTLSEAAQQHGVEATKIDAMHPTRMELIAMAALRAAMQPQTTGLLSPQEVAHMGDAMMIQ